MTDAELAKAVADACGIEVINVEGEWYELDGDQYSFNPATSWECAMLAADKCGLFERHHAELSFVEGQWMVWLPLRRESEVFAASGPRAICEAILMVKGVNE